MRFTNGLESVVALVTGAASGIGLGTARALASSGASVALADIDEAELEKAVQSIEAPRSQLLPIALDVTARAAWGSAIEWVNRELGEIGVLVNNAGISTVGTPFEEIGPDIWDRVVEINLTGVYNGVQASLPSLRRNGGGHIVNCASIGGIIAGSSMSAYSATKFAVVGLSEALRAELEDINVGVSVLCPGPVRTRLWQTSRRAKGLPEAPTPPDGVGALAANGMDPGEVGWRVVAAILGNHPYIFTHPEYRAAVEMRHQALLAGIDSGESYKG